MLNGIDSLKRYLKHPGMLWGNDLQFARCSRKKSSVRDIWDFGLLKLSLINTF